MSLPYFFIKSLPGEQDLVVLDEDVSKHVVQVLRMKNEELVLLTNGQGVKAIGRIVDDHRKHCTVTIEKREEEQPSTSKICLAISLIKNNTRFEWFLEKATEIGVQEIIPLICDRTEKEKFRTDRMQNIVVSAMLQSQQCWLPNLREPTGFEEIVTMEGYQQKFIAHCLPGHKQQLADIPLTGYQSSLMLIGPEGDFTSLEIESAIDNGFIPVALGETRLRTETAGLVAATLLCIG